MSHWQNAIEKVSSFCDQQQLLNKGDALLIGLSGGPDSVFLAELLAELSPDWRFRCHLAHVNYQLRGEESDEDQRWVERWAKKTGWSLDVHLVDKKISASAPTENFQAWARRERYQFFAQVAETRQASKIVVAHHLTDQIETFLLRLLRGSGPSGLGAMRPRSQSFGRELIRPMLPLTREEILAALEERHCDYRHDVSNDSIHYRRNYLRHQVLPLLAKLQPGYERAVGESLLLLQGDDALLNHYAEQSLAELGETSSSEITLSRSGLQALPKNLRLRLLRLAIGRLTADLQSITFHHVGKMNELICGNRTQSHYDLPGNLLFEQGPLMIKIKKKGG